MNKKSAQNLKTDWFNVAMLAGVTAVGALYGTSKLLETEPVTTFLNSFDTQVAPEPICELVKEGGVDRAIISARSDTWDTKHKPEYYSGPISMQQGVLGTFKSATADQIFVSSPNDVSGFVTVPQQYTEVSVTGWMKDASGRLYPQGSCSVVDNKGTSEKPNSKQGTIWESIPLKNGPAI